MAEFDMKRMHEGVAAKASDDDEPMITVQMAVTLRGDLATVFEVAELAARLDELLSDRYQDGYRGPSIRLSAEVDDPARAMREPRR
jgi:hypothetical protein